MSIADNAPENTPTTYKPIIVAMASEALQEYVTETRSAVAIVTDSPGIAPINKPSTEPRRTRRINLKSAKYDISIEKFILFSLQPYVPEDLSLRQHYRQILTKEKINYNCRNN